RRAGGAQGHGSRGSEGALAQQSQSIPRSRGITSFSHIWVRMLIEIKVNGQTSCPASLDNIISHNRQISCRRYNKIYPKNAYCHYSLRGLADPNGSSGRWIYGASRESTGTRD
ncbi:MAG TPA: hypothetical protein PKD54_12730, partial [Pirellulaceae bacterium]|nr:hypothetical protein [Pirellulaceae bacterium]